jgi:tryptophan synthase alpha chain
MSRLEQAFKNGKAFIPFVTAGDPDLETTERLVLAMARPARTSSSSASLFRTPWRRAPSSSGPTSARSAPAQRPTEFSIS